MLIKTIKYGVKFQSRSNQNRQKLQVNLFQKHSFLNQLTHNMSTDCSLNYQFSTWKFQVQNILRTYCVHKLFWMSKQKPIFVHMFSQCSKLGIFMYWTGNSMNNLSSYCGLVDARISASEKDLPVTAGPAAGLKIQRGN